jgi:probable F420-dependent oxidoreductase
VKIGVALPHYGNDVSLEHVVSITKECERLGFDSVWVSDHLVFDFERYGRTADLVGCLDPMTTLTVLARETERVRLGTMVLCNEFRHPIALAKEAAAVDLASDGRLELGIGAGWYEREFDLAGLPFPRAGVRLERLAESVEILKAAFAGDPISFEGSHYRIEGMVVRPRPAQRPRPTIWIGAKAPRSVGLAAKVGDGWNAAHFQDPDDYARVAGFLRGASIRRSIGQYARGSPQEMVDRLGAFAALDVEHAVMCFGEVPFSLDDPDDLARFAQDVLPQVR